MFIIIRHRAHRRFLVNTNCTILLLLHYIRRKVRLHKKETIDLCDEKTRTMKFLFLKNLRDYANKFLTARRTYYVCKVKRSKPVALRKQCDALEKKRLKILRIRQMKEVLAIDSFVNVSKES
ncbi:uncharacterized protein CXorf65 homolog [Rhynchocyon petersi]